MKIMTVLLGVIVLIAGAAIAAVETLSGFDILGHHRLVTAGGIGLALIGAVITGLGATSKPATTSAEFKCPTCGAIFASENALKSHSKDKHGKQ